MRYRALTASGDYSFGQGRNNFLVDSVATVAQAVRTALLLFQGEWYLDTSIGVPWLTQIVGTVTDHIPGKADTLSLAKLPATYDQAIQSAIKGVTGVTSIVNYLSSLNRGTRKLTITVTINTVFGVTTINPVTIPLLLGGYGVGPYGQRGYGI